MKQETKQDVPFYNQKEASLESDTRPTPTYSPHDPIKISLQSTNTTFNNHTTNEN